MLDDRFPFLEDRRAAISSRTGTSNGTSSSGSSSSGARTRSPASAPVDSRRAPAPRRPEGTPSVNVVVFGDSMADWLAYGLEEAFAETPEIGITRKPRPNTGLIRVEQRGEAYDWPSVGARHARMPRSRTIVVMMLGIADRRGIREAIRQPARPPAGQKQATDQAKQPQPAPARASRPAGSRPRNPPTAEEARRCRSRARYRAGAAAGAAVIMAPEGGASPERWCTSSARRSGASFTASASRR